MPSSDGMYTYAEIKSQGEVWQKVLAGGSDQLKSIDAWRSQEHDEVIFIGCGSTHYLSLSAARLWTLLTHEPARGLPSSELWYYGQANFSGQKPLIVAVSRSGETTETIHALETYQKAYGLDALLISCYPDSPMGKSATFKLLAPEAQEKSVAQTRSFSSMYLLSQLLAGYAAGNRTYLDELNQLPALFSKLVSNHEAMVRALGENPQYQHFVFLGSGVNYGLASEVMLKMKEMSTSVSEVFHFMEFRHGPMSMVTDRSLVIGLLSDARQAEEAKVLQEMKKLGATTLALANHADRGMADYVVDMDTAISDPARAILNLPLLQLMGYYHSLSKGLNPDLPKNLSAVVYL